MRAARGRRRAPPLGLTEGLSACGAAPHWDTLAELFTAPATEPDTRALVQVVLMEVDVERTLALSELLPMSATAELAGASTLAMLTSIEEGSAPPDALAVLLSEVPPDGQLPMIEQLEAIRKTTDVPAAVAWGPVLRRRDLRALHDVALAAVVEDGGYEAVDLLTNLKARAGGKGARRRYDKALQALRANEVSPSPSLARRSTRCYVTPCDGQGAFVAMMATRAARGRVVISDLAVRVTGGPRDGFLIPDGRESDLEEILDDLGCHFGVELAPPGEVSAVVMRSLRRGKAGGVKLSRDTRMGLRAFEKTHQTTRVALQPVPPRPPRTRLDYDEMLSELPAWFLDGGDLAGHGIAPPPEVGATPAWISAAAARIQGGPVHERLLGMTDYQTRWFTWVGEDDLALVCASAHTELGGDLGQSAFLAAVLARSGAPVDADDVGLDLSRLGGAVGRADLRVSFFPEVRSATGLDLARLDFTEAADLVLERAFQALPGELRPAADLQRALAHTLGCLWVETMHVLPESADESGDFESGAAAVLARELGLAEEVATELAEDIGEGLEWFEEELCSGCDVHCLGRLRDDQTKLFHSSLYPPWVEVKQALSAPISAAASGRSSR